MTDMTPEAAQMTVGDAIATLKHSMRRDADVRRVFLALDTLAALAQRVEEWQQRSFEQSQTIVRLTLDKQAAEARADALEKEAGRYRHLRQSQMVYGETHESFDAMVDAAIDRLAEGD